MAYVCSCRGVNDTTVREAVAAGAETVDQVIAHCAAGSDCGGCHPTIETLIMIETEVSYPGRRQTAA